MLVIKVMVKFVNIMVIVLVFFFFVISFVVIVDFMEKNILCVKFVKMWVNIKFL